MGFLDGLLGRKKMVGPAPDRLFALTTAYVTLEIGHQITTTGKGAIVFQPIDNADFDGIAAEMEELVRGTGEETGTTITTTEDSFGYRWMVFSDPDVEDLVVAVNTVNDGLQVGGYGERVLCAVFSFKDGRGRPLHLIYNVKRGKWYPFAPAGENQRDSQREMQIKAILDGELPVEPELERWFPLWGVPL
ncbi:MAG: hypothetical protein JHC95_04355 [Solirubrobacteraceae bacterium]|nr:hypothetical protein [Solirubrobacteraceae bacterium]